MSPQPSEIRGQFAKYAFYSSLWLAQKFVADSKQSSPVSPGSQQLPVYPVESADRQNVFSAGQLKQSVTVAAQAYVAPDNNM